MREVRSEKGKKKREKEYRILRSDPQINLGAKQPRHVVAGVNATASRAEDPG